MLSAFVRARSVGLIVSGLIVGGGTLGWQWGTAHRGAEAGRARPSVVAPAASNTTATASASTPSSDYSSTVSHTSTVNHKVQAGETLAGLGRLYQVDVGAIKSANGLTSDQIRIGQTLQIPSGKEPNIHIVGNGETLWTIASRYDLSVAELLDANRSLSEDPGELRVGQKLWLPTAGTMVPRATGGASSGSGAPTASRAGTGDRTSQTSLPALAGVFHWPVLAPISSPFGPRDGRLHAGIDLAANQGDEIKAARAGKVTLSGPVSGYGNTVILRHADGTQTLYAHASKLLLRTGDSVSQGQTIALVGSTGHSTGPHLHFEVIVNNQPYDPLLFLPRR